MNFVVRWESSKGGGGLIIEVPSFRSVGAFEGRLFPIVDLLRSAGVLAETRWSCQQVPDGATWSKVRNG